jgi:hypothetical protein
MSGNPHHQPVGPSPGSPSADFGLNLEEFTSLMVAMGEYMKQHEICYDAGAYMASCVMLAATVEGYIWPQIYGMMLNDACFKLTWKARQLTGKFSGPLAQLIYDGYLTFQMVAIRRLCDKTRGVISLRKALLEAKRNKLAPDPLMNELSNRLDLCDPVCDMVNDYVAHTADPSRRPNISASTCKWEDLFKAQEAICSVAITLQRDLLGQKVPTDIIPVQQGDIMEDFRLWVPDAIIQELYKFWHAHNKEVNAWKS